MVGDDCEIELTNVTQLSKYPVEKSLRGLATREDGKGTNTNLFPKCSNSEAIAQHQRLAFGAVRKEPREAFLRTQKIGCGTSES